MTRAGATVDAARVLRRSALESEHLALGARWVAADVHWPTGYGASDLATQRSAVAGAAGIAEIGPLDELLLRGPDAGVTAARLLDGDRTSIVGRAVAGDLRGEPVEAWFLGPDEVLLLAPVGGSALAELAREMASAGGSAIEMTGARTSLRLAGPAAPAILAELCPDDTTPMRLAATGLIQAPLGGVRAFIVRQDAGVHPGYTIMVARDEAAYVWEAIRQVGAAHGLVPVGPSSVAPEVSP